MALAPEQPLRPAPDEVEAVVEIDLEEALATPHLPALSYQLGEREGISPIFELGDGILFGASAHVLYIVLSVAASMVGRSMPPMVTGAYRWDIAARRPVIVEPGAAG